MDEDGERLSEWLLRSCFGLESQQVLPAVGRWAREQEGRFQLGLVVPLVLHRLIFPEGPCRRGPSTSQSREKSLWTIKSDFRKKKLPPF